MKHNALSLEQKIIATLGNTNAGSQELAELIEEVEQAAAAADQAVATGRREALDLVACPDPEAAHQRTVIYQLGGDRLRTAIPKLRDKLSIALAAEARDRWSADYRKVKAKVEEAALLFKDFQYHAETITAMFGLASAVDKEVSRINGSAPDNEHRRLLPVELTARGMTGFTRDNPSLASTTSLPEWSYSARTMWPPHPSTTLAVMAAGIAPYHPGGAWADPEVRAQRRTEVEKSQRELGAYHEQAAKDEESRLNREERERSAALPRR